MIRFPPQKILVAYDMSDVSRMAWRHAQAFAASTGAELEVVYVEPWKMGVDLIPPPDMTRERAHGLLADIRKVVGDAKTTILLGDPAARILHHCRRGRHDMIVVGTHARKGLDRVLLGSVAEAVIRGARVPVLTARGRPRPIRSVLAPVNFTSYSDFGFSCAAAVSSMLSARLTVLHVENDPIWGGNPHYRISSLLGHLPAEIRAKCKPAAETFVGDPVEGILKAKRGHDCIVLVAHEKSVLKDAFFGTTLERVLRRSTIPVLSVPSSEGAPPAARVPRRVAAA